MPRFPFEQISTVVDYSGGHTVQWRLSSDYRARPPVLAWLQVAESTTFDPVIRQYEAESFFAVDSGRVKQSWNVPLFYRIRLQDYDGKVLFSDPFDFDLDRVPRHKYLLASEIVRKEWVRFQYVGCSGWLLKRRHYGNESAQEVDPITRVPVTDNPTSCGTGFDGGYYPPVRFIYSQEDRQQETRLDEQGAGVRNVETVVARCPGFPAVDVQDIVVAPDGKRWSVADVQEKYFPGTHTVLIHVVKLRLIPNTDSVYSIQVGT